MEYEEGHAVGFDDAEMYCHLDCLLSQLGEKQQRLRQIAELKAFIGLNLDEIATELCISRKTVQRDLEQLRSLLMGKLQQ